MKTETIEALALELTKAIIADQDPLLIDKLNAGHWINTYKDSLEKIKVELNKDHIYQKPMTGGKTVF